MNHGYRLIFTAYHMFRKFISKDGRTFFDPYSFYKTKIAEQLPSTMDGENILITIIGGAYGHLFEGLFARKAMLAGKHVTVLRCGGYLSHCESIQDMAQHKRLRCAVCMAQQDAFLEAFGTDSFAYQDLITAEDEAVFSRYIEEYFEDSTKKHCFMNTEIDRILYSALQRYYLVAVPSYTDRAVVGGFLHTILATLTAMERLTEALKPKYVLSSHGTYSAWGAVVEYCKAHGIYVVTYGQNYNKCGMEFTYDDSYLTGDLNDKENKWMRRNLSEDEKKRVTRFLDERLGRVNDDSVAFDYNKNNKQYFSRRQLCEMLGVPESKKLVGLFPNIPWDGQVTGGSVVFERFSDWLKACVDYFASQNDAVLVIRSHPAEVLTGDAAGRETTATMLAELYSTIPNNVIILPPKHPINSYTLGENVDFGISYSSTITLELTYIGIPVILCGCPPFKDKGIAFDIDSIESFYGLLRKGLNGELAVSEEQRERLNRYIHYFFFMRTMPQTLVEIKDTIPVKFLIQSEKQLDNDPVFAEMFRCVDEKLPMNFSSYYQ